VPKHYGKKTCGGRWRKNFWVLDGGEWSTSLYGLRLSKKDMLPKEKQDGWAPQSVSVLRRNENSLILWEVRVPVGGPFVVLSRFLMLMVLVVMMMIEVG
jgi:hypothetical protein